MLSKKLTALVVFVFVLSFTVSSAGVSEKVQDVPLEYDEVLEDDYRLIQARNVSLGDSNMPASWQVTAARIAEEAYELQSSDSGRLSLISELFSDAHPFWYWNIALNYRYVYHHDSYYVQLYVDGDDLYLFSTR